MQSTVPKTALNITINNMQDCPRQERQKQPEAIRSNEEQPRAARTSQGQPEDSRGWPGARQQRWAACKRLAAAEGGQERPEGSGKRPEAACGARERAV